MDFFPERVQFVFRIGDKRSKKRVICSQIDRSHAMSTLRTWFGPRFLIHIESTSHRSLFNLRLLHRIPLSEQFFAFFRHHRDFVDLRIDERSREASIVHLRWFHFFPRISTIDSRLCFYPSVVASSGWFKNKAISRMYGSSATVANTTDVPSRPPRAVRPVR